MSAPDADSLVTDLENPDLSLELDGAQLRQLVEEVLPYLEGHLDSLEDQPAWNLDGAESVAAEVPVSLPDTGEPVATVLGPMFERWVQVTFNTASPGYLAYIPGGGLPQSAVADLIAGCVNRYVAVWTAAPALARIEATVIRWFCNMVGLPPGSGGFLTTGGSLANWSGLLAARERLPLADLHRATIYWSDQAHHCVAKAVRLIGLPEEQGRVIPSDAAGRIECDQLLQMVRKDRSAGHLPLAIVASAGSTNTGAVDDLERVAGIAERERLWMHVDAAYGGFFMLTDRGRKLLRGIERADSIVLDPHKGLFLPYGTGCLLARRQDDLRQAHQEHGEYMPPMQTESERVDFCAISPELSRDFRALRIWLPFRLHGLAPFRNNLDEKMDLARWAARALGEARFHGGAAFELAADPLLSLVAFRLVDPTRSAEENNQLNRELLQWVNEDRRVFLTATQVGEHYLLRICVLSFRTHLDRVRHAVERLVLGAARLLQTDGPSMEAEETSR